MARIFLLYLELRRKFRGENLNPHHLADVLGYTFCVIGNFSSIYSKYILHVLIASTPLTVVVIQNTTIFMFWLNCLKNLA